jgi:acetylornithine/succinyldiaminopimelate/putrescine aminotransferase/predicted amino acid dehydrogenase
VKEQIAKYGEFIRPTMYGLLKALRLDVEYTRGAGDYLYYADGKGEEIPVLDLAGGFGSTILGHNNPEIKKTIQECVARDIPMHSQGSVREDAGRLAEQLSNLFPGKEKRITFFTNSGTEAVECALKHAELNRMNRFLAIGKSLYRNYNEIKEYYRMHSAIRLPKEYREKGFDTLLADIIMQTRVLEQLQPIVICAERSFHGKTTGSLRITGNPLYREAFQRLSGIDARFVELNNLDELEKTLGECWFTIRKLEASNGDLSIIEEKHLNLCAFIMEPIQGEGGIRTATSAYMAGIQRLRKKFRFEWIIDEIQTGMGRTGKLFAIENFAFDKDAVDYVVLSKSLGGGTHKIGAMMVRESIHDPNFGLLHTSTFAEDSIASIVGLKSLEILTRDGCRLLRNAAEKGDYFIDEINKVKADYPGIIKEVRGIGLMIGVEFTLLDDNKSLTFSRMGAQGVLGSVLAGYMFHEHRIRTAPPLNSLISKKPSNIIRIEPSAYISMDAIDHTVAALRRACEIVKLCNSYEFTKFVVGKETPGATYEIEDCSQTPAPTIRFDHQFDESRRMAFLIHPLDIRQVVEDFDPSLQKFSAEIDPETGKTERERFWDTLVPLLDSFVYRVVDVKSPRTGDRVRANFIGFLYTTKQMIELRKNNPKMLVEGVQKAVDIGTALGAQICGLGAFTSIVTHNGTDMDDTFIRITSGNSYTSALVWQSVLKAAQYMELNLAKCTCAIVGAGGNIGSVTASLLSEDVSRLLLIGRKRKDSIDELRHVAHTVYSDSVDIIRTSQPDKLKGLPAAIAQDLLMPFAVLMSNDFRFKENKISDFIDEHYTGKDKRIAHLIKSIFHRRPDSDIGKKVFEAIQLKHGADPYITLTTDVKKFIPKADIIISAVSADTSIIDVSWIKPGAIINDVSLPPSVSLEIYKKRPDVLAIQGGIGHLPEYIDLGIPGLAAGATLGCMAETFILTMMHMIENFSFGAITKQQVIKIWEAGNILGFGLAAIKYMNDRKLTRDITTEIKRRAK